MPKVIVVLNTEQIANLVMHLHAFPEELVPAGCAVYTRIYASSHGYLRIGAVHYRVHLHLRYVISYYFKRHFFILPDTLYHKRKGTGNASGPMNIEYTYQYYIYSVSLTISASGAFLMMDSIPFLSPAICL